MDLVNLRKENEVLDIFCELAQIPSPSLKEEKVAEWIIEFCNKNMIKMVAYSPLGGDKRDVLEDEVIIDIAKRNNVTPAQVVLAWNMERGVGVIPKSISENHLQENIGAINVELDEKDMMEIENINREERFLSADVFKIGAYKGEDIFV